MKKIKEIREYTKYHSAFKTSDEQYQEKNIVFKILSKKTNTLQDEMIIREKKSIK